MALSRLSGSSGPASATTTQTTVVTDSSQAGLGNGVLRVMMIQCSSARTIAPPAGWTEVLDVDSGLGHLYLAYHWATDAEVTANTSWTFTISGGATFLTWRCTNWGGVDPTNPFDVAPFVSTHTFSDTQWDVPGMTTLTPGAACYWLVGFGPTASSSGRVLTLTTTGANTWTQDSTQVKGPPTGTSTGFGHQNAYEIRATPGPTGTRNVTISGSSLAANLWRSIGFALKPYIAPVADVGDWFEALDWTPPTMTAPGNVLNIGAARPNHFAVQLAAPDGAAIETHDQDEISAGYRFYPWFYGRSDATAAVLRAPVAGPVTSGASATRCELRELDAAGANIGFDALVGTHVLHGRSRILHAPPNLPDMVLAQLHNGTTDRVTFRTQLVSGTWRLRLRVNGTSVTTTLGLDIRSTQAAIEGTEFEWKIEVANNLVRFYLDDMTTPIYTSAAAIFASTGSPSWYFKAGCYLQTPATGATDDPLEYGAVELRDLSHSHAA